MSRNNTFSAPFDKLATTRRYARQLAIDTNRDQVIVRCHPLSAAAQLGCRYGVLAATEIQDGDPVVERFVGGETK